MASQGKGRLIGHFENRDRDSHNRGWAELWESKQEGLWDRGKPSPALIDFIEQNPHHLPKPQPGKRLKALVPACGRGYDVVMLALHGFNAYGLEINETAVKACEEYAQQQLNKPDSNNFSGIEKGGHANPGTGSMKYTIGNFFTRDWEAQCTSDAEPKFDLIYDYTFLCAIMPEMRLDWARRIKELLAPSGILVCLEFPLYKDLGAPGPPYGLKGVYDSLLADGDNGILDNNGLQKSSSPQISTEESLELLVRYKPERTYEVGEGTDMLSVWRHKEQN